MLTIIGFDYSILDASLAAEAQEAAKRIKNHDQTIRAEVIKIGLELIEIRRKLPRGSFGPWLDAACQMSERTCQNYMNYAEWAPGKSATVADLPLAIGYALSATTADPGVVREIIEQVDAGARPTAQEIRDKLAGAKAIAQKQVDTARLTKHRENEKRLRAEREASALKEEDAKVKAECVQNAAEFLVQELGIPRVIKFFGLLGDADISSLKSAFHHGDWANGRRRLLTEAEIETRFGGAPPVGGHA